MPPREFQPNDPVWQLVRGQQGPAQVLEKFGIDYCCGGDRPLEVACSQHGVSVEEVLGALERIEGSSAPAGEIDWSRESMTKLADHIVERHHAYVRDMLPKLAQLLEQVLAKHGIKHPNLFTVRETFAAMQDELFSHMMREEMILFPFIRSLDQALQSGQPAPRFHCGTVKAPIEVMKDEHQTTSTALARMRELTSGFQPPDDACKAYRLLLAGLRELEADLHLHIHKENNILFPRATEAEASLPKSRSAAASPDPNLSCCEKLPDG